MPLTTGEVRLAWGLLILLAALSYPAPPAPQPIDVAAILLAFGPGTIMLSTATGATLVIDGLRRLASRALGRVSLLGAVILAILLGFTFDAFIAFALTGVFCSLLWSMDRVFRASMWDARFGYWIVAGLSTFTALAVVDCGLNWRPIARQLGTPGEVNDWENRYTGIWGGRNLFRFRSPYEDTRRRPGVRRVIALGDSFTWGSKIASSDSTWPALLERFIAQAPNAMPTEVINMAHGGYATGNEAEELRRIGWQFHPDLVIVQWLDNDARQTQPHFEAIRGPFVVLVRWQYRTGWIRDSSILQMLENGLAARFYGGLRANRKYYTPHSRGWLDLQRGLREMGDSASRNCTPILLVLYPYLFPGRWTLETYPERKIHELVATTARSAGFEVLDLLPTFVAAGKDFKEWWGTAYDTHPGGAAQVLTAATIARYLQDHQLLADTLSGCRTR